MTAVTQRWASSYRLRLAIGYLLIVAVFALAWAWSLFGPLTSAVIDQQREHLQAVAQAGTLVLADSDVGVEEIATRLVARTDLRLTVVAADGTVLADSDEDPSTMENHAARAEIVTALEGDVGTDRRLSATQGTEQIYVAVPASYEGDRVVLRVASPLDEVNAVAAQARRTGLILLAFALVFAALVVSRLVRIAAEPISELTRAAQAMAEGRLGVTIPQATGELNMLSDALENLRDQMRHRLEDLEAEQRNLRAVLDGLSDAVFLLHGDRVRFANRAASELFRKPATGWRNRAFDNAGLPASVYGGVMEVLGDRTSGAFECGPDPHGRYLRVAVIDLNPADSSRRTLVTVGDITERTSVDAVRRDFVANASHELKTPASAIQLLAESAVDAASHGDSDQAVEFARQIAAESARLGNLVRDLLDLSRLEAGADTVGTTDMRAAVENTLLAHRNAASESGLGTSFDDEATGVDAYVRADATDVAVALDNLLDNAIKYTESGSVSVSLCADEKTVTVSIQDTGPAFHPRTCRASSSGSTGSIVRGLGRAAARVSASRWCATSWSATPDR